MSPARCEITVYDYGWISSAGLRVSCRHSEPPKPSNRSWSIGLLDDSGGALANRLFRLVQERVRVHVSFPACRFPDLLIRPPLLDDAQRPWTREDGRIVDRGLVVHGIGVDEREPLRDMRVLAVKIADVGEAGAPHVRRIDGHRVAFPVAAAVAHPQLDVRRDVRAAVKRNDSIRVVLVPHEDELDPGPGDL